jgi:hypothetical protein
MMMLSTVLVVLNTAFHNFSYSLYMLMVDTHIFLFITFFGLSYRRDDHP